MTAKTSDILLDRMMSLHPKIIDLTLDRVYRLLAAMDNPQEHLPPVIHIAGTNGKGSTQAMLRAGFEAAGETCHAYTSPHLARFHERIRVAGSLISEDNLNRILDDCLAANGPEPITYFEITTVAALLAFSRWPADWCLLEVGLGGRMDATNVIDTPRLTIITPVSLDHQQYLGETVEEIAGEKAGILKRGVPCIVAPQPEAAMEVIEDRAARTGAPLIAYGQQWHAQEEHGRLVVQDETGLSDLPLPNLRGPHQIQNAGTAVVALRHLGYREAVLDAAVTRAEWPARMQRLTDHPLNRLAPDAELWLDGGHNVAAGAAMAATLDELPKRETHMICGMLNTKDVSGYLAPLRRHARSLTGVTIPETMATLTAQEAADAAAGVGIPASTAPSVAEALSAIAQEAPNARVLICGSLYLAGAILREAE